MNEPTQPQIDLNLHQAAQAIQQIFRTISLGPNTKGWFQRRKDAVKLLETITHGTIALAESGYRGHKQRHWMQHRCGYTFLASMKEVSVHGAAACPYCYPKNILDLKQFGSTAAVQDLVTIMAADRVTFLDSNVLMSSMMQKSPPVVTEIYPPEHPQGGERWCTQRSRL